MRQLLNPVACASALGVLFALASCSGGSTSESSTLTVAGDVPIAYAKRVNTVGLNPTNGAPTADGGDLMIREKSSACPTTARSSSSRCAARPPAPP
jgi:hypothetical protein